MRRRVLSFDAWLCLALAVLVAMGTGAAAQKLAQKHYAAQVEAHKPVDGQIGGRAGEEAFRAQSVDDLLSHDTFTVVSPGIQYRNRGAGFLEGSSRVRFLFDLEGTKIKVNTFTSNKRWRMDSDYILTAISKADVMVEALTAAGAQKAG